MKIIALICLFSAVIWSSARADFFSPFADSKVDSTVTSDGVIVADAHPGQATAYFVRFRTDTGPKDLPAEIPPEFIRQEILGRQAKITATIRERDNPDTKARIRFLVVLQIEITK